MPGAARIPILETNLVERPDRGRIIAVIGAFLLIAVPGLWWIDQAALPGSIDGGWMMSLADAAARGEISGRDVYATYGWAFQQIGLLARKLHVADSTYDSLILQAALMVLVGAAFFAAALHRLRELDSLGIVVATLVVSVLGLAQPAWVRPAALIFVVVWTAGALAAAEATTGSERRLALRLAFAGAMASAVQLMSFDYGVFSVLALALAIGGECLWDAYRSGVRAWARRALLRVGAVLAGALVFEVLLCMVFASGPGRFLDYPRVLWEMSNGYSATLGSPWQGGGLWMVALGSMVVCLAAAAVAGRRHRDRDASLRLWFLVCGGLVSLRGATTRSDVNHISLALIPLLCAFVVAVYPREPVRWLRIPALLVTAALVTTWPGSGFGRLSRALLVTWSPSELVTRWRDLRSFDSSTRVYVPAVLRAGDPSAGLMVFPHFNQFAVVAKRRLFMPFVQPYQATTARLDRLYAQRLLEVPGQVEALYAFDGVAVGELDGVASITRNPAVFETLWGHFPAVAPAAEGHVLLRRRTAQGASPEMPRMSLVLKSQTALTTGVPRGSVRVEATDCSLLRVAWHVTYPWTRILGRSSAWRFEAYLGDQKVGGGGVVALDDRFATYLTLMPAQQFSTVFFGGAPRTRFDRIDFVLTDGTFLAAQPRRLAIESIDCVNP